MAGSGVSSCPPLRRTGIPYPLALPVQAQSTSTLPDPFRTIQTRMRSEAHPHSSSNGHDAPAQFIQRPISPPALRGSYTFTARSHSPRASRQLASFYCSHHSHQSITPPVHAKSARRREAVKKKKTAAREAASASPFRTKGGKGKQSSTVFLWSPRQTLAPAPAPLVLRPHHRRRRGRAPPMAKSRPPKRILESYTIKGSDKVIKRECPFAPV